MRHTGGSTLQHRIRRNFSASQVFPFGDADAAAKVYAKVRPEAVLGLSDSQLASVEFFSLHQPLWVRDELAARLGDRRRLYTMTVLRDPIERTLSHVKRLANLAHWSRPLEDFYSIPRIRKRICWNHQVREFLRTAAGDVALEVKQHELMVTPNRDTIDVEYPCDLGPEELGRAKAALETVDAIGFTETLADFIDALAARFGWKVTPPLHVNATEAVEVAEPLRARIETDAGPDLEFYSYARDVTGAASR